MDWLCPKTSLDVAWRGSSKWPIGRFIHGPRAMTMRNLKALENHLKALLWQIGYDRASAWNQGVFGECIRSIWGPIWHILRWITLVTIWIERNDWGCSTISSAMVWKPSTSFGTRARAWWRHLTKAIETHQDQFDNDRDYLAWVQPIFGNPLRSSPNHVPIKHRGRVWLRKRTT